MPTKKKNAKTDTNKEPLNHKIRYTKPTTSKKNVPTMPDP